MRLFGAVSVHLLTKLKFHLGFVGQSTHETGTEPVEDKDGDLGTDNKIMQRNRCEHKLAFQTNRICRIH